SRTAEWVADIADAVALPGAAADAVDDYRACVFIHVAQAAWKRKTLPWVRLYRRNAGVGAGAAAGAGAGTGSGASAGAGARTES
ncbi:hypothetical protein, partial [Streptomyces telluris]|uniref:hypothetical protein n=1 Tax=Streptomyces telluris TaxID=2720021 RepID=UPI0019D2BF14